MFGKNQKGQEQTPVFPHFFWNLPSPGDRQRPAPARRKLARKHGFSGSTAAAKEGKERLAGGPVSRVLCRAGGAATVIYLAGRLPGRSSDLPGSRNGPEPALLPYLVLLPVGFAEPACHQAAGGLLPRHFTLTSKSSQ